MIKNMHVPAYCPVVCGVHERENSGVEWELVKIISIAIVPDEEEEPDMSMLFMIRGDVYSSSLSLVKRWWRVCVEVLSGEQRDFVRRYKDILVARRMKNTDREFRL